jgi:hypothetical protein
MLWMLGVSSASSRVCGHHLLLDEANGERCFHHCMNTNGSVMVMRAELIDRQNLQDEDGRSHESRQKGTRHRHLHRAR